MLQAVTFDLWSTLIEDADVHERVAIRCRRLREELAPLGVSPTTDELERAFMTPWATFEDVWVRERRTLGAADMTEIILASLGCDAPRLTRRRIVTMMEDVILEVPPHATSGAQDTLHRVARQHRLGLICDTALSPGRHLRVILARLGLLPHLRVLSFSDEVGVSKPDPRVFERVLLALGVQSFEATHVGDMQRTDVAGALAAGMHAIHFVGANRLDEDCSTAEAVIHDLSALPPVLAHLGP